VQGLARHIDDKYQGGMGRVVSRVSRGSSIPVSPTQRGLWFLHQFNENLKAAYNLSYGFRIKGRLKTDAVIAAFNTIVDRHEILRTTFSMNGGEPVQIIKESLVLDIPVVEVSGDVDALVAEHAGHVF